jgi:transcriptional regulator
MALSALGSSVQPTRVPSLAECPWFSTVERWPHENQLARYLDDLHKLVVDNHGMGKPSDLVQGTLDLLILKTILLEPKHGWAIAKRIQQVSGEVLQVQQGSLYPALHRLEQQGWIKAKWAESETGRQAKFYALTAAGRKQLEAETANWNRLSAAIDLVVTEA